MAIIIAVFLIAVLLYMVLKDKAGEHRYNNAKKEYDASTDGFDALYTDPQLEDSILACFDNSAGLPELHREIACAFCQMSRWKGTHLLLHTSEFSYKAKFTKREFDSQYKQMCGDRKIALDILLANRGKVSHEAAWLGYKSYVVQQYTDSMQLLKERQFELVEWICSTLDKQGVHLTPVYVCDAARRVYGWRGSKLAPEKQWGTATVKPFDHSLIERPNVAIPDPYYGKDTDDSNKVE